MDRQENAEVLRKAFALACRILGGEHWKSVQEKILEIVDSEPVCRVCGCTQENACPGGCYWAEKDLCSTCVECERGCTSG